MKKTILVDLDGICADLFTPWLEQYNNLFRSGKTPVKIEDITDLDILKTKNVNGHIYKVIDGKTTPNFFRTLKPLDGAISAIKAIKKAGHNVVICSAPSRDPNSYSDKVYWVKEHLGIKSNKNIIITGAKHMVMGDYLIDDSPKNIAGWLETNPNGVAAQILWPWNVDSKEQIKADGWQDTKAAWKFILENIL